MAKKRWKVVIEYKGTEYCGWQRQEDGVPSVQQAIEAAIYGFCQQRVTTYVAGRTDAGVHARGQVAHFDLDYVDANGKERELDGYDLAKALNAHLAPQPVAVINASIVNGEFQARFDAINKLYRYRIINRPGLLTIDRDLAWHFKRKLDVSAMHDAAQVFVGTHDFTTFRDSQCQAKSPEKTIDRIDISGFDYDGQGGREIVMEVEGRSFLHHQVRNFAGTLTLVGEGKWTKDDVKAALEARDRTKGGPTAPAEGLYLMRIDYES